MPSGEKDRVMADMTKRFRVFSDFKLNGLNKFAVSIYDDFDLITIENAEGGQTPSIFSDSPAAVKQKRCSTVMEHLPLLYVIWFYQ